MKEKPLAKVVSEIGQAGVAKLLKVSPPAIHKAIKTQRNITVVEHADSSFSAYEKKPFGGNKSAA